MRRNECESSDGHVLIQLNSKLFTVIGQLVALDFVQNLIWRD
jgi:hypothetical protein